MTENPTSFVNPRIPVIVPSKVFSNPRPGDRNPTVVLMDCAVQSITVSIWPASEGSQVYIFTEAHSQRSHGQQRWIGAGPDAQVLPADFVPDWVWTLTIGVTMYDYPSQADAERAVLFADELVAVRDGWISASRRGRSRTEPGIDGLRVVDENGRKSLWSGATKIGPLERLAADWLAAVIEQRDRALRELEGTWLTVESTTPQAIDQDPPADVPPAPERVRIADPTARVKLPTSLLGSVSAAYSEANECMTEVIALRAQITGCDESYESKWGGLSTATDYARATADIIATTRGLVAKLADAVV